MSLKITPAIARILQALRPAPMDSTQISERFVESHTGVLTDAGLISFESGYYKLTAKGRELCPNRRCNMPPAPVVPVVHRKQIDLQVKPVIVRSSELVALPIAGPVKHLEKKDGKMTTPATPAKQSMALQILQFIEANPNCVSAQITAATGAKTVDGYIRSYIDAGKITATRIDPTKRNGIRYKIADGLKVQDFYRGLGSAEKKATEENMPKFGQANESASLANVHADDDKVVEEIRAFASAYNRATPTISNQEKVAAPNPPQKIRFAITSEHTLIIQGASYQDIELSAKDTEALVEFVESIAMTIPVHGYSIAGASL